MAINVVLLLQVAHHAIPLITNFDKIREYKAELLVSFSIPCTFFSVIGAPTNCLDFTYVASFRNQNTSKANWVEDHGSKIDAKFRAFWPM